MKRLEEGLKFLKDSLEEKSKETNIGGEVPPDPVKEVIKQDLQKCSDCDYQCEKRIQMIKHVNTKHRKSLKCDQCGEMLQDIKAL